MKDLFTIVPNFLKDPQAFYQEILENRDLKGKAVRLFLSSLVFLMTYGFVTGLSHNWKQAISTAIKMPVLFMATLLITLPALYFFSLAFLNVRFAVRQAGTVVLSGIGVSAFLLLGLAPVTAFFDLTSTNYPFFQLLAVVFVAISGCTGVFYMLKGIRQVDTEGELSRNTMGNILLKGWVILFGFVGSQMTWRLSPFLGDPQTEFVLILPSRDNFFMDVLIAATRMLGFERPSPNFGIPAAVCSGVVLLSLVAAASVIVNLINRAKNK